MRKTVFTLLIAISTLFIRAIFADDGYRLWLKYDMITNSQLLDSYKEAISSVVVRGNSETIRIAENELLTGLNGLLGSTIKASGGAVDNGTVLVGTYDNLPILKDSEIDNNIVKLGREGFIISTAVINEKQSIIITANKDIGILYGVFNFLKLIQTHRDISNIDIVLAPKTKLRMLNHWDMYNRAHEYNSLPSIWEWHTLPVYIKQRYIDYARANASIGINGISPNCVDADPRFLTHEYLEKLKVLADTFRPYGIQMFMSPNFNAPMSLGGLKTADPNTSEVREWWTAKVKEIYELIPDFGGFLVKANSEDEPGPGDFGKTQAEGANMFAEALKPHGGIVIWRTFVYEYAPEDRAREAYDIFKPLDEVFLDNVVLQVKNGPLDFSPREPFSPLFGATPYTPILMEVDIGMGPLGKDINVGYMAPMWRETLMSDTYAKGEGSTVARVIDGTLFDYKISGLAGVSNAYQERNWTGNLLQQSNWYTFGILAWDYNITSEQIADDWIRMTFSHDEEIVGTIKNILMDSREHMVNYMTPLGLNMIGGWGGFRGPWTNNSEHATWNSPYYHHADSIGLGFDRTVTGSNYVEQYFSPLEEEFASLETCPEKFLLWFHHIPWTYKLNSGSTLWNELCHKYYEGVEGVENMIHSWNSLEGKIDEISFKSVKARLQLQYDDAVLWRDGCILYFQAFSKLPIPEELEKPEHDLKYYIVAMSRDKVEAVKMAESILQELGID